jgi:AcrR family transcriptional regulator
MEAALALVRSEGLSAVTLRRLSQQVGVSSGAPFRHVASRAALLARIATEGFHRLRAALIAAQAEAQRSGTAVLPALGVAYVHFALSEPAYFRIMQATELGDRSAFADLQAAADEAFNVLCAAVRGAQQEGSFPPGDPDFLALGPWAAAHGLAMLALDGQLARRTLPSQDPVQLMAMLSQVRPGSPRG